MPRKFEAQMKPSHRSLPSSSTQRGSQLLDIDSARVTNGRPDARPEHFRNLFEECIFVFTVTMAASATTFLQGIILINTNTIGKSLQMTAAQIIWIAAAVGLSSGSFMLFFGKTADIFGKKLQLLLGMLWLSACSLITAFIPSALLMNIFCGLLGLGTAAIAPPALGVLFATYPEGKRRNAATGALGCGNPVGFVLGSLSAGVATHLSGWRASFIVIAVFFFLLTILAFWTVPQLPRNGDMKLAIKQFDYLGSILIAIGMGLFTAALTEGPGVGWSSPKVIIMLVLGVFSLFGFVIWESLIAHPILDLAIWKDRTFSLSILCALFGYTSFITNLFWTTLYMQDVQHFSPILIAVRLLPQTFIGIAWSFLGQWMVPRVNGTILMGAGALAYLVGAVLLMFVKEHSSYWAFLFPSLLITVMGADFQFIVANLYIGRSLPTQASLGAGILQTAFRLAITLGVSVSAAVYGSVSKTPIGISNSTFPYERAYLCSIIFALLGLLLIPFMRVDTHRTRPLTEPAIPLKQHSWPAGNWKSNWSPEGSELTVRKRSLIEPPRWTRTAQEEATRPHTSLDIVRDGEWENNRKPKLTWIWKSDHWELQSQTGRPLHVDLGISVVDRHSILQQVLGEERRH